MTKTTIELLSEAREWLTEHWCGYYRWRDDGANCALGAIERAAGDTADSWLLNPCIDSWISKYGAVVRRLMAAAAMLDGPMQTARDKKCQGFPTAYVASFNDSEGKSRVLEMFRLAIQSEQEDMNRLVKILVESSIEEHAQAR